MVSLCVINIYWPCNPLTQPNCIWNKRRSMVWFLQRTIIIGLNMWHIWNKSNLFLCYTNSVLVAIQSCLGHDIYLRVCAFSWLFRNKLFNIYLLNITFSFIQIRQIIFRVLWYNILMTNHLRQIIGMPIKEILSTR